MGTSAAAVLAFGAHPDDIEFMMSGTLLRLKEMGWELHCMNIANGSCGTVTDNVDTIVAKRAREAEDACAEIGAVYHASICNDLEIFHSSALIRRVLAVVREVKPAIVLAPAPQDYMEDHMNTARLAVAATFARGMCNYASDPPREPVSHDVTIYHAQPHGLRDPLRRRVMPGLFVDISDLVDRKRAMLACHRSQKEWLDKSQGMDAYLDTMTAFAAEMGRLSGKFEHAEGWRRRLHYGFDSAARDPLFKVLGDSCLINQKYEADLG